MKKCSVRPWRVSTTGIVKNAQSKLNRLVIKLTHCQQIWGENRENWTKTSPGDDGGALCQPSCRYYLCCCLLGYRDVQCHASWYNYTVNENWICSEMEPFVYFPHFYFPSFPCFTFYLPFASLQTCYLYKDYITFLVSLDRTLDESRGQPMLKKQKNGNGEISEMSGLGNINIEIGSKGFF